MKAFILAAGVGNRLRPLTLKLPKPMIPLVNKPVIAHTLDNLKKHNINSVVMNLHFMADTISSYFGDGRNIGMEINYSKEENLLGTAGGLKKCKKYFDSTFVVLSGDNLCDIDITSVIEFHKKKKSLATMVLKEVDAKYEYGIAISDKYNRITNFVEKPTWSSVFSNTVNTGIYVFEPEIFKYIPDGFYDFGKGLWPKLLKMKKNIYSYVMNGYWTDIGSLSEYQNGTKAALDGTVRINIDGKPLKKTDVIVGKNTVVDKTAKFIGKIVIGKNCNIGKNVFIDNGTVIGNNVTIKDGSIIKDSIIWDNVVIGKNVSLNSTIVDMNVPQKLSVYKGILFNTK